MEDCGKKRGKKLISKDEEGTKPCSINRSGFLSLGPEKKQVKTLHQGYILCSLALPFLKHRNQQLIYEPTVS